MPINSTLNYEYKKYLNKRRRYWADYYRDLGCSGLKIMKLVERKMKSGKF